ncbi:hypothetical protein KDH_41840 [Dictyobacter sp. S3.2.2.5]|uniref:Uncharacterized protein n=1 Tax=Dictyobacter halimunensis TaxID=3026934 RepID=A0ABQ6FVS0_9CHLR|nr:hypothetical protein KDH_41840 [Dictyobacter sp. S3.2.2.5]
MGASERPPQASAYADALIFELVQQGHERAPLLHQLKNVSGHRIKGRARQL